MRQRNINCATSLFRLCYKRGPEWHRLPGPAHSSDRGQLQCGHRWWLPPPLTPGGDDDSDDDNNDPAPVSGDTLSDENNIDSEDIKNNDSVDDNDLLSPAHHPGDALAKPRPRGHLHRGGCGDQLLGTSRLTLRILLLWTGGEHESDVDDDNNLTLARSHLWRGWSWWRTLSTGSTDWASWPCPPSTTRYVTILTWWHDYDNEELAGLQCNVWPEHYCSSQADRGRRSLFRPRVQIQISINSTFS